MWDRDSHNMITLKRNYRKATAKIQELEQEINKRKNIISSLKKVAGIVWRTCRSTPAPILLGAPIVLGLRGIVIQQLVINIGNSEVNGKTPAHIQEDRQQLGEDWFKSYFAIFNTDEPKDEQIQTAWKRIGDVYKDYLGDFDYYESLWQDLEKPKLVYIKYEKQEFSGVLKYEACWQAEGYYNEDKTITGIYEFKYYTYLIQDPTTGSWLWNDFRCLTGGREDCKNGYNPKEKPEEACERSNTF